MKPLDNVLKWNKKLLFQRKCMHNDAFCDEEKNVNLKSIGTNEKEEC